MKVLVELYDRADALSNVISLTVLKPDVLILLGVGKGMEGTERILQKYVALADLKTDVCVARPCLSDIADIEAYLEEIIRKYGAENCIIDVLGGNAALLLAVGACSKENDKINVVSWRADRQELVWLMGPRKGETCPAVVQPTVAQVIALAGGELVRNARVSDETFGDAMMQIVPKVFHVYMKHRSVWPQFVLYMQRLVRAENACEEENTYCAPTICYVGKRRVTLRREIVEDLHVAGALTAFEMKENLCRLTFASALAAKYLCDVGSWLELYTYVVAKKSGLFHEVQVSAVISWDNDRDKQDITNEIDLIALCGIKQWFISCKTAVPDNTVLNEIAALTHHFGARFALPVLVTASKLAQEAPGVYRRAMEMGIAVFEADDMEEERFIERLKTVCCR